MTPNTLRRCLQGRTKLGTSSSDAAVTDDGVGLSKDAKRSRSVANPAEDVASIKCGPGISTQSKSEMPAICLDGTRRGR
ncbi:MAG: hypothetical protein Udaeo2_22410 [Candidatus Udaeobacter sp.]|nr:MAG: hypothetical protein Udaeo2_22410 [Candidatus Udaeobacter sp.]